MQEEAVQVSLPVGRLRPRGVSRCQTERRVAAGTVADGDVGEGPGDLVGVVEDCLTELRPRHLVVDRAGGHQPGPGEVLLHETQVVALRQRNAGGIHETVAGVVRLHVVGTVDPARDLQDHDACRQRVDQDDVGRIVQEAVLPAPVLPDDVVAGR